MRAGAGLFALMGITDTFMLSGVSDEAVAAVGAANQFVYIAILLLEVIGNGAAVVVSQYIGSRKLEEAAKIGANAITLNLWVGSSISICFLLFGNVLLTAMHLQGEILSLARSYMAIVGGGLFLQAIINTLASMIRTYGFTRESMLISLGMNIVHVAGNYLLIFGHLGFPALGVEGAAISTVASRGLGLLVFFWAYDRLIEQKVEWKEYVQITKAYVGKICRVIITGRLVGAGRPEEAYGRVWKSLPLGYFLAFPLQLGLAGVWMAVAADEWIRGIVMFFRWRSRAWERKSLVDRT